MKALTIRQPHASLVAVGTKTIETRSKPTSYRGPLLIHAGKRPPEVEGAQRLARVGDWWVEDTLLGTFAMHHGAEETWCDEADLPLPLGAVVASCQLADCVPVDALGWSGLEGWRGWHYQAPGGVPVRSISGPDTNPGVKRWPDVPVIAGIEQLPFGDFSPGRYAWLLGDVKPTTERCPRCWGARMGPVERSSAPLEPFIKAAPPFARYCRACSGNGVCDPVPMRGRQGLWTPTADDWAGVNPEQGRTE